ncbi:hypothetical protein BASA60_008976 [Batrachochytrium salamandrivorans]|nr:hypothetical protein BASA60_008976 [Batrachochytrium salamandrivorans]
MRLSAISLSMYLIGTISASPYPAGGSGSVSESTEPVKSAFKWFRGFGINKPKEPQDTQTQEHDNEDTTTSNVGPEHDPPGFTDVFLGPDEDINAEVGSTEESEDFTPGQIQTRITKKTRQNLKELPRDHLYGLNLKKASKSPKNACSDLKGLPRSHLYEPQDTQTQEQSDEDITTPNVGPEHDSSDSTGAATGSDEATNTDVHQEEENEGSTAEQTQAEVHREESPET